MIGVRKRKEIGSQAAGAVVFLFLPLALFQKDLNYLNHMF